MYIVRVYMCVYIYIYIYINIGKLPPSGNELVVQVIKKFRIRCIHSSNRIPCSSNSLLYCV